MRRTKAEAEETRCGILSAAERVFYEKGVANTTLEDVATAAGVTRGAIYWHFTDKTDLFLELCNSVPMPQEDMVVSDWCTCDADILSYIETRAGQWLDAIASDEQRQRIFSILLRCGDNDDDLMPVLDKQREVNEKHSLWLEAAFGRVSAQGHLNDIWTPRSATKAMHWMIKGLCSDWLLFGRRFDLSVEGREALSRLFCSFREGKGNGAL